MAIVMESSSNGNAGSGSTVNVTAPGGTVSGNILIAHVTGSQDQGASTTGFSSSGWTSAAFWNNNGDAQLPASGVLWKVAGSEPGSYSFSMSGASGAQLVHVSRWSGVDTSDPFAVAPTVRNMNSGESRSGVPAPSVAIPGGTGFALVTAHIGMRWYGNNGSDRWSAPSGMSAIQTFGEAWVQMGTFYELVGAGDTGNRVSSAQNSLNQQGRGIALALRPSGGTPPPTGPEPGRFFLAV